MPEFEPNEHLFEKHADKGKERWEIFAWSIRDAMSKASGLEVSYLPNRVKSIYSKYIDGHSDEDPTAAILDWYKSSGIEPPA